MTLSQQLAKNLRDAYNGGNWTGVSMKDHLMDLDWKQVTAQIQSFNTIAKLVFHINYYVIACTAVLKDEPLNSHDKYSFDCPPINSQADWETLRTKAFDDMETFAKLVESLPESKIWETFADEKYGNYFRNIMGVIEHAHYHLGQIVLLKKMI